ncbi:MAG: hypothetical protein WA892_10485, partial [Ornithinimicrobium sp.]
MNRRAGLATLAARLSDVYPDIGPAAAQAWVVAAVDALVHALVDLADGRNHFTQHTEVRALPLLERQHTRAPDPQVDRASCAAAAAEVRQVQHAARPLLSEPGDRMTGAADRA